MEISVQIFTGSFGEKAGSWCQESIVQKLNLIYETTQIKNAIIGWNARPEIEKIVALLKEKGRDAWAKLQDERRANGYTYANAKKKDG